MKKIYLTTIGLLVVAGSLFTTQVYANVADDLTNNYNNTVENCGSGGRPAFLCSGVMIRATKYSVNYNAWDPSPRSIKQGGVSFSYIRKDAKLTQMILGYNSGIIFYPSSLRPDTKQSPESLCAFPIDGATDGRSGMGGCEAHFSYPTNSQNCQSQGIYNANTWYANYISIPLVDVNRRTHQCGFNVSIGTPDSSAIFMESLKAQQKIFGSQLATENNEIVVKTWETDANGKTVSPETLPIQSFFYTDSAGLVSAKKYQKDYYLLTKIIVPIVKVTFPRNNSEDVKFSYSDQDQNKVTCTID